MNLFNIIQGARIGMTARYQAGDMVLEAVLDCLQSTWADHDDASLSGYRGTRLLACQVGTTKTGGLSRIFPLPQRLQAALLR